MVKSAATIAREENVAEALPARRCFTADEFHRLYERRVLPPDERTELIEGDIIRMAAIGSRHFQCVNTFNSWLVPGVGDRAIVSVQNAVRLSSRSEPQPDLALLHPRDDGYSESLPGPADVLLLIEVSDTTFPFDRKTKLPLYAAAGIPEVWLAQIARKRAYVYRDPREGTYQDIQIVGRDGFLSPLVFPDLRLPVAQLFK